MKFTVQYETFLKEFGFVDVVTKEFDSLQKAYKFYNENKKNNAQLYQGVIGDKNFARIH